MTGLTQSGEVNITHDGLWKDSRVGISDERGERESEDVSSSDVGRSS